MLSDWMLSLGVAWCAGLDTCLAIMKVIFEGTGDSKYRPCPLLRQYVDAGKPPAVRLTPRLWGLFDPLRQWMSWLCASWLSAPCG